MNNLTERTENAEKALRNILEKIQSKYPFHPIFFFLNQIMNETGIIQKGEILSLFSQVVPLFIQKFPLSSRDLLLVFLNSLNNTYS